MTYRERRAARAERLRGWAAKREQKSAQAFRQVQTIADGIPFGQPILVGHHSEKHHRRDLERIDGGMRRGIEHADKAREMVSKAANIEAAADAAIYSDDPDAIEALTAKLAGLEAERARIKVINKACRKHGLLALIEDRKSEAPTLLVPAMTDREARDLLSVMQHQSYYEPERKGFPPYHSANLSGNISRTRKRLEQLTRERDGDTRIKWDPNSGIRERLALLAELLERREYSHARVAGFLYDSHRDQWSEHLGDQVIEIAGEGSHSLERLAALGIPRKSAMYTIGHPEPR